MEEQKEEIFSIDIKAFFKIIWKEKWWIIFISLFIAGIGAFYAFSLKEEFTSTGKILPESQSKGGSSLGQFAGLASLAGVDIGGVAGSGADAVRPDLYPDVLTSTPFFLDLFQLKVKTKENKEILFKDFYQNNVLDGKINEKNLKQNFPQSDKYVAVSYQTELNIKDLKSRISGTYDKKTGIISISTKLPDPVVATLVTRFSMDYLTNYVITYRTEKSKQDLQFLADRLDAAKGRYYSNQEKKLEYSDQFQLQEGILKLKSADKQRERIESEYRLTATMYNGLLQKYEEAKMKLQQETPVIKVLEPPVVPNKRSYPNKILIVIVSGFLGVFLGLLYAIFKKRNYKIILTKA